MPPKAKFTQEQVIKTALQIVENEGLDKLTARYLGEKLGSSARPIFTVFNSMDEVTEYVKREADAIYTEFVNEGLQETPPFKGVGMSYIKFARERPKLFQLLFMKEHDAVPDMCNVLRGIESNYDKILSSVQESYNLNAETAQKLYLHIWIYTHGIAVLLATNVCAFTEEQTSQMLTDVFVSLLVRAKNGEF